MSATRSRLQAKAEAAGDAFEQRRSAAELKRDCVLLEVVASMAQWQQGETKAFASGSGREPAEAGDVGVAQGEDELTYGHYLARVQAMSVLCLAGV